MTVRVRSVVGVGLAVLLAGAPGALAEKKAKPPKGKKTETVSVTVTFTTGKRDAVRGWYAEKYGRGNCPPGLAKKNNGCLPPGQAKKHYTIGRPLGPGIVYGPVPPDLGERIGPPPAGHLYVTLDGDLPKLAVGTLLVVWNTSRQLSEGSKGYPKAIWINMCSCQPTRIGTIVCQPPFHQSIAGLRFHAIHGPVFIHQPVWIIMPAR